MGSVRNSISKKQKQERKELLGVSFRPENFIPGLIIGFIFGFFLDLSKPAKSPTGRKIGSSPTRKNQQQPRIVSSNNDEELKMVLVVRQDLKMGSGKIASQCAHAATGMYAELMQRSVEFSYSEEISHHLSESSHTILHYNLETSTLSSTPFSISSKHSSHFRYSAFRVTSNRSLLRQWELCGQAKIVVTCKNQQEMNKLNDAAESIGLPTFTVADAGRTQVSAGSKTVLAIGPGNKSAVDSVTGKQRLL